MARNIRVVVQFPTPSSTQSAIKHGRIEMRAVASPALPWAVVNTILLADPQLLIENLAPGDYEVRGVVVDVAGKESSPPNQGSATIDTDAPSPFVSFTVSVE